MRTVFVLLGVAVCAAAQTLYVSPTGSDAGTCTAAAPCREIRRALALAAVGTTILVADGQYKGFTITGLSGTAAAPVTIRAQGSGAEVLPTTDRSDNRDNILVSMSDYIVIEGLRTFNAPRGGMRVDQSHNITIRNCTSGNNTTWGIFTNHSNDLVLENNDAYGSVNEHGIYVSNSGDRPTVRGNRLHDNAAAGLHMNGDLSAGGGRGVNGDGIISFALVERNVIYNNGALGAAGINMDGVQHSVVRNNLLYGNHASGIAMYRIDGGAGPLGNEILHNTIDMASNGRWALRFANSTGANTARNNIFYNRNTARGGISYDSADVVNLDSDYNIFGGSSYAVTPNDGGTRYTLAQWQAQGHELNSATATEAALWQDAAGFDYHLAAGSPAVDAGAAVAVAEDIEGNARPAGAGYDIGAYESGATPGCSYSISPSNASYDASGGTGTVAVTANCEWTAARNDTWISIDGTTAASVAYTVAANTGAARTGTLTIATRTFTVTQSAAPAVVNPGFETGSLAPWTSYGRASASVQTTLAHSGTRSARVSGKRSGGIRQTVSGLTPGRRYRIGVWARSAAGTAGQASLISEDSAGAGRAATAPRVVSSAAWEELAIEFVATGAANVRISLNWSGGSGAVFYDDATLAPL